MSLFPQLKEDVDFLGRALGIVLQEHEGQELFQLVERVRGLTKDLRAASESERREKVSVLRGILADLDLSSAERLVRAFTVYFQLINLAEEIHRVRVNRARQSQASDDEPKPESVAAAIKHLKDEGWSYNAVCDFVSGLDVQLTVTAHPTEVKRYTVRLKLERIASALRHLREWDLAPQDRQALRDEIYAEVSTLWRTRELFARKPTVLDEVKSALYYYRRSLLDAVPRIQDDVERALRAYYPTEATDLSARALPAIVRFRSWIGGDRDGNPFVTPGITRETYRLHSEVALERSVRDVDHLVQRLSQWQRRLPPSEALARLNRETKRLTEIHTPTQRFQGEPFRKKLFYVHRDLVQKLDQVRGQESHASGSEDPRDLARFQEQLVDLEKTLRSSGEHRAADAFVRSAVHRSSAFGFHLAALDLREHSRHHEAAVADLFRAWRHPEAYRELSENERVKALCAVLESEQALIESDTELEPATLKALEFLGVFKAVQNRLGLDATGGYVVSMAEDVSDVLEVLVLARAAGVTEIDATPLFETVADLENAPGIVERLLAIPVYRAHVDRRGLQEVMIGYSDSNKDAGFLAANWALFQAQEGVARVCRDVGVPLRIFHGRGTSIGRGGGPAGQAILAQPPGSLGGRMRTTEQGEALDNRYSDPDLAHRHLEQVTYAFLLSSAQDAAGSRSDVPTEYREALDRAAAAAKKRYRDLLESDGFLDFFHSVTPIDEISRLDIGSRPARRAGEPSLDSLRAIPWVFSWTQCRANLPGWYGLGSGLGAVDDSLLAEMYREWPFFQTLLDFAQMSLAKADLGIFESYLTLVRDPSLRERFGGYVFDEFERSERAISRATGGGLLAADPTLARSIRLRNPYVDPISYLQVELLKRLRSLPEDTLDREALDYAVKVSLVGVSAGMRNTG